MKVFISWSGEQSRQVALALHEWLPQALQAAKPYMSEMDNEAGGLWDHLLAADLETSDFGIVCLTPSNLESRWMNFEAGALSKAVTKARVVPLLFRLKNADVGLPMSRFQMKSASREGILDTVKSINANADADWKVDEAVVLGTFESVWPKLESKLEAVSSGPEARVRSDRELLEEVLELVRGSSSWDYRRLHEAEKFVGTLPTLTPDLLAHLREIAGPNGHLGVIGGPKPVLVVTVPSLADIKRESLLSLGLIDGQLGYGGVRLEVVEEPS